MKFNFNFFKKKKHQPDSITNIVLRGVDIEKNNYYPYQDKSELNQ